MNNRNLRYAFQLEISALEAAQIEETRNGNGPSHDLEIMIQCWNRALHFIDEPDPKGFPRLNYDRIREMNDAELLAEIWKLQGNAAACPACFKQNGYERLKYYLGCKVDDDGQNKVAR